MDIKEPTPNKYIDYLGFILSACLIWGLWSVCVLPDYIKDKYQERKKNMSDVSKQE